MHTPHSTMLLRACLAFPLLLLLAESLNLHPTTSAFPGSSSATPSKLNQHDLFHGLLGAASGRDMHKEEQVKKKPKMVNVPYFVGHLISHQDKPQGTNLGQHAARGGRGSDEEHDHTLHKQGHCRQSMQIENSHCDYDTVETVNLEMRSQLSDIVNQKYFKFYKLNLYGTCPFWTENHFCTNEDCSVALIDERSIPQEWTSAALGAISSPMNGMSFQPFKSCQLKDQDFCQVDDEANGEGVYVDLTENPERFTGYSGPSSAKVWDAIYNENCFNVAQRMQLASDCEQCSLDREASAEEKAEQQRKDALLGMSMAKSPVPFNSAPKIDHAHHEPKDGHPPLTESFTSDAMDSLNTLMAGMPAVDEEICLEKRVFYRMVSGLHASISIHICDEYFNQTTGIWGPNLDCFVSRVGAHPDRLENIYFNYAMLVRAVTKLSGYLQNYEFCTGNPSEDTRVKAMVDRLIETSIKSPAIFDEKAMFVGPEAQVLKMEFRDHFRNITKIMDCVGCEKCRLWGKVQTSGLGTALKVLFSYNDEHLNPIKHPNLLQRTEIVALFNTFNRLSESVESIGRFRTMYMDQYWPARTPEQPPQANSVPLEEQIQQSGHLDRNKQVVEQEQGQEEHGSKGQTLGKSIRADESSQSEQRNGHPAGIRSYFASVLKDSPSSTETLSNPTLTRTSQTKPSETADPRRPVGAESALHMIKARFQSVASIVERTALRTLRQPLWFLFPEQGDQDHSKDWSVFGMLPKTMASRVDRPSSHPLVEHDTE